MEYTITIALMVGILVYEIRKYRYTLYPTIIYPVMWIFALIGLIVSKRFYQVSNMVLMLIVIGYLLFCFGFYNGRKTHTVYKKKEDDRFQGYSSFGLEACYVISIIVGMIYVYLMRQYLSFSNLISSLSSVRMGLAQRELRIPTILVYFSSFSRCTMYYTWVLWLRIKKEQKYKTVERSLRIKSIVLLTLNLVILMTSFSRNSLLFFLLPLVFLVFLENKSSNRTILISFSVLLVLFLVFFFWFSQYKASYLFEGKNYWEVALENLYLYLSGGIVGLDQMLQTQKLSFFSINGLEHVFSFFTSISDTLLGTSFKPEVVQPGILIGNNISTNVYTVYQWIALDLGIIPSVLGQYILGYLYGSTYKKMLSGSVQGVYWISMLSYPLIMMFFQDQYLSISQSWVPIALASFISYKLIFRSKYQLRLGNRRIGVRIDE